MSISPEYKAAIPLKVTHIAWLLFVFGLPVSFVVGDWLVFALLGWFAFWEGYGILTPRPGDTYSERNWAFTANKPARLGLTLGLVGYMVMTLVRLAWEHVYGAGAVADGLKFASALGFLLPATGWLCWHFIKLGKDG